MKILTLGPKGTFSHLAALKVDPVANITFVKNIREGFEILKNKKYDIFIAPVENMIYGTVRQTIDGLHEHKFKIEGSVSIPISHSLLAKSKSIKKIYSHNQALNQCSDFLKKKYKNAELISCSSTAEACNKAVAERSAAAIAHKSNLQWHPKLQLIADKIEDKKNNRTKFLIIGDDYSLLNEDISSIIIEPDFDKHGVLFKILKIFKKGRINLTKIESRPTKKKLGSYIFYIDFEGDFRIPKVRKVLQKIEKSKAVKKLRILGSYSN